MRGILKVEKIEALKYIESILFALGRKVSVKELSFALDIDTNLVEEYIKILTDKYIDSGINIVKLT